MVVVPATSRGSSGGGITVLSYVEFTSSLSVTGTTPATAQTLVTAAAVTADGSTLLCIEGFAPVVSTGASVGAAVRILLFDGTTNLGELAIVRTDVAVIHRENFYFRRYYTPSAASITYSIRAYRDIANGNVDAGPGGAAAGDLLPAYIRVTSGA